MRGSVEGTPARFVRLLLEVQGRGVEPEQLEKMAGIAERGCVVANTLTGNIEFAVRVG